MYEEYWGLREKPFENTPNPRFYYQSPEHEEAYARMLYAIRERKGACVISGEYGCGKTLLGRALMQELDNERYEVAVLFNPKLSALQFLKELVRQLGGNGKENDKVRLMQSFSASGSRKQLYRLVVQRGPVDVAEDAAADPAAR